MQNVAVIKVPGSPYCDSILNCSTQRYAAKLNSHSDDSHYRLTTALLQMLNSSGIPYTENEFQLIN